jgi:hypothetical protein
MTDRAALDTIATCLAGLLGRPALSIPLIQRAKFEGWLKVELAGALVERGASAYLESSIEGAPHRADIEVEFSDGSQFLVMLKTVNTNFRFSGVVSATRPITRNIDGVIEDLGKLRLAATSHTRLVAFPVFPVAIAESARRAQLAAHINRVVAAGGHIEREGLVVPPCSGRAWGVAWYVFGA